MRHVNLIDQIKEMQEKINELTIANSARNSRSLRRGLSLGDIMKHNNNTKYNGIYSLRKNNCRSIIFDVNNKMNENNNILDNCNLLEGNKTTKVGNSSIKIINKSPSMFF